jgi:hypothetical protein
LQVVREGWTGVETKPDRRVVDLRALTGKAKAVHLALEHLGKPVAASRFQPVQLTRSAREQPPEPEAERPARGNGVIGKGLLSQGRVEAADPAPDQTFGQRLAGPKMQAPAWQGWRA